MDRIAISCLLIYRTRDIQREAHETMRRKSLQPENTNFYSLSSKHMRKGQPLLVLINAQILEDSPSAGPLVIKVRQ